MCAFTKSSSRMIIVATISDTIDAMPITMIKIFSLGTPIYVTILISSESGFLSHVRQMIRLIRRKVINDD